MNISFYKTLLKNYNSFLVSDFMDRYLSAENLNTYLIKHVYNDYSHETIGHSEQNRPITGINFGQGTRKILIWSQMHGNESTTTKVILDFLRFLQVYKNDPFVSRILNNCRVKIIPMLNPDGATAYSRLNSNQVDLNRDAQKQSQKETQSFYRVLKDFEPDFCFNMHGQRSIFSAGDKEYPATLSFLSPAVDEMRGINETRQSAMKLIASACGILQEFIPHKIGRYDDAYNPNCYGDYIQGLGIPTVLFEAGHYPGDYFRNKTRQYVFLSLLYMLDTIAQDKVDSIDASRYSDIPLNKKLFHDIIVRNAKETYPNAIGICYKEVLVDKSIHFIPHVQSVENLDNFFAHRYYEAKQQNILSDVQEIQVGDQIDKIEIDGKVVDLKF